MSYAIIGFGIYVVRFKRNVDIKSVAYDSNGSLWYAGCNGVGRLTRSHAVRDYLVDDGCNGQAAVSVAPDGLAWFFAGGTSGLSTRPARCVCSSLSMRRRRCRQANLIRRITPQGTRSDHFRAARGRLQPQRRHARGMPLSAVRSRPTRCLASRHCRRTTCFPVSAAICCPKSDVWAEARLEFERALALAENARDRAFLQKRADECSTSRARPCRPV